MEDVLQNIYEHNGLHPDDIFSKAWSKYPTITVGQLIPLLLKHGNGPNAIKELGRGTRTFNSGMATLFPDVKLNGGNQTWFWFLLSNSDYKKCGSCSTIKLRKDFGLDNSTYDLLHSMCKDCKAGVNAEWYDSNKDYHVTYVESHRAEYNARTAKRRALILQRTVKWADLEKIKQFYINCPKGYHVDHYYPLQGEKVCGLHVIENLQYLTAKDNISKSNNMPT